MLGILCGERKNHLSGGTVSLALSGNTPMQPVLVGLLGFPSDLGAGLVGLWVLATFELSGRSTRPQSAEAVVA